MRPGKKTRHKKTQKSSSIYTYSRANTQRGLGITSKLGREEGEARSPGGDDPDPSVWMRHQKPAEREVPRWLKVQHRGALEREREMHTAFYRTVRMAVDASCFSF